MNHCVKILLALIIVLFVADAFAQSKKDLEKRKNQLQKEIEQSNKLLTETQKNKKSSLNQLVALNNKITKREEIINTISFEIKVLEGQIEDNQTEIAKLELELSQLKEEYALMIYYAYKNRSAYDKLMFLFSSKDFNQAYKRLRYFQQYSDYRKVQAEIIENTKSAIVAQNTQLATRRADMNNLLESKEMEKQKLSKEKSEKESMVSELQKKEKQLKDDLKKKQNDAKKLNDAIKRIIEEELRKAREEAAKAAAAKAKAEAEKKAKESGKPVDAKSIETPSKPVEDKPMKFYLTPEAEKLSNTFASNQSKLPWPVTEGFISGYFGEHDHPVLKGIKIKNNGIDITTKKNAVTRAVFEGEVSGVASIPDAGKVVIIRHGEYLTVYSNLEEIYVKKGDKVKTKQNIGVLMTDEDNRSELHFEIWKGSVILNPTQWISN
jgi:murein hydrolase activator